MQQFPNNFQGQQFGTAAQWGGMQTSQQPGMQFNQLPQQNQFIYQNGATNPMQMPNQGFSTNQFGAPNPPFQQPPMGSALGLNSVPNPFFGTEAGNLQQQFGNLSIGNVTPSSNPTSLTSNVWH